MASNPEKQESRQLPSSVTDAVLVPSNEMPVGAKKVEELDFNKFAGRPITVDDLMSGMNNMGFQATSIGEAVRIINDMVCISVYCLSYGRCNELSSSVGLYLLSSLILYINLSSRSHRHKSRAWFF